MLKKEMYAGKNDEELTKACIEAVNYQFNRQIEIGVVINQKLEYIKVENHTLCFSVVSDMCLKENIPNTLNWGLFDSNDNDVTDLDFGSCLKIGGCRKMEDLDSTRIFWGLEPLKENIELYNLFTIKMRDSSKIKYLSFKRRRSCKERNPIHFIKFYVPCKICSKEILKKNMKFHLKYCEKRYGSQPLTNTNSNVNLADNFDMDQEIVLRNSKFFNEMKETIDVQFQPPSLKSKVDDIICYIQLKNEKLGGYVGYIESIVRKQLEYLYSKQIFVFLDEIWFFNFHEVFDRKLYKEKFDCICQGFFKCFKDRLNDYEILSEKQDFRGNYIDLKWHYDNNRQMIIDLHPLYEVINFSIFDIYENIRLAIISDIIKLRSIPQYDRDNYFTSDLYNILKMLVNYLDSMIKISIDSYLDNINLKRMDAQSLYLFEKITFFGDLIEVNEIDEDVMDELKKIK